MIDSKLLDKITAKAEESPRQRMNYNIHKSLDSHGQKLINVLLPGTVLPVHRHKHTVAVIQPSAIFEVKEGPYQLLSRKT